MAKARSRAAARKVKDKWKAKTWYNVLAPEAFNSVTVAETLADEPEKLIKRVSEVSLQDITNDFRKSHIKLYFEIHNVDGSNAHTRFIGHTLTSDYLRRMIRRKRSKVDGIYDVITRDGARVRIKPFATTDHRIQNSQKKIIRETMKKTIVNQARTSTLSEFVKIIIEGKIGSEIYKNCKKIYPVKRVEIYKTHVISHPTRVISEPVKPETKDEPTDDKQPEVKPDDKEKTVKAIEEKVDKPVEEEVEEEEPEKTSEEEEPEKTSEEEVEEEEPEKTSEEEVEQEEPESKKTKENEEKEETKKE